MGKVGRRPQAAKSPAKRAIQRPDEGIGPYKKPLYYRPLIRHGFAVPPSPQGEGFWGDYPLIRPSGPPSPRGEGFLGEYPLIRPRGEG